MSSTNRLSSVNIHPLPSQNCSGGTGAWANDTYNGYMSPDTDPTLLLPCWLEVDLDAVADNVRALQHWVGPATQIAAVVKAQGYGVGATQIARTALQAGARWLAVARV